MNRQKSHGVLVGMALAAARGETPWSQEEVARRAGLCRETVRLLEAMKRDRVKEKTKTAITKVLPKFPAHLTDVVSRETISRQ